MSEEPAEDTKARVLRSKARTRRLSASLVKPVRGPYFASGIPPPIRIVPPPSKVWAPVLVKPGKRVFSAAVSASCRSCLRGAWSIFRRVLFQARLWVSQRLERLLDLFVPLATHLHESMFIVLHVSTKGFRIAYSAIVNLRTDERRDMMSVQQKVYLRIPLGTSQLRSPRSLYSCLGDV